MTRFDTGTRVHFVGIGGVGMSAIAKVLVERGCVVSGSDIKESRTARTLEAMGASIHIGHSASVVEGADVVVVSSAINDSNPELVRARELGSVVMTRGEALAEVLSTTRSVIVAGTHGKTTTTSMIVSVLRAAGRDPTYLVGGGLNDSGTNALSGRDDLAVAESDESDGSFLLLEPWIAVVTNVESDHLDHWGSLDDIRRAFSRFLTQVRPGGSIVLPAGLAELAPGDVPVTTFGDGGDLRASSVELGGESTAFTIATGEGSADARIEVPGRHNVDNALAAAAASLRAGLSLEQVARGLGRYRGVERRLQIKGRAGGVTVIDDYAHHPSEVRATLAAVRPAHYRSVVAVFQPHLYSRTRAFAHDFGAAFEDADRVVVTDVYGAREQPVAGITGKLVADAVCERAFGRPVAYLPHRGELVAFLEATIRPGDAVLTLGAGDIHAVGEELLARLGARR